MGLHTETDKTTNKPVRNASDANTSTCRVPTASNVTASCHPPPCTVCVTRQSALCVQPAPANACATSPACSLGLASPPPPIQLYTVLTWPFEPDWLAAAQSWAAALLVPMPFTNRSSGGLGADLPESTQHEHSVTTCEVTTRAAMAQ